MRGSGVRVFSPAPFFFRRNPPLTAHGSAPRCAEMHPVWHLSVPRACQTCQGTKHAPASARRLGTLLARVPGRSGGLPPRPASCAPTPSVFVLSLLLTRAPPPPLARQGGKGSGSLDAKLVVQFFGGDSQRRLRNQRWQGRRLSLRSLRHGLRRFDGLRYGSLQPLRYPVALLGGQGGPVRASDTNPGRRLYPRAGTESSALAG